MLLIPCARLSLTIINIISHQIDSAGIRTPALQQWKPALYRVGHRVRTSLLSNNSVAGGSDDNDDGYDDGCYDGNIETDGGDDKNIDDIDDAATDNDTVVDCYYNFASDNADTDTDDHDYNDDDVAIDNAGAG